MWDLAMLQIVPGIKLSSPRDANVLRELLNEAVEVRDKPTVIRFGKGTAGNVIPAISRTTDGVDILKQSSAKDVLIMSVGAMAATALHVADLLAAQGIGATVIDPRWVVPVPQSVVEMSAEHRLVVTIEDGIKVGGIGTRVRQDLRDAQIDTALTEIGLPDEFIDHATRNEILEDSGLTAQAIARNIVAQVVGSRIPHARSVEASSATSDATKPSTIS
jgi:1-deoxy-D-xylulose-5-phosphate synthase